MPGTNDSFTFGTSIYSDYPFGDLPKGDMFSIAMNPYNGLVIVKYNCNPVPLEVIDTLLDEIHQREDYLSDSLERPCGIGDLALFCKGELSIEDFEPCPFCGNLPVFDWDPGDPSGHIQCCGGALRLEGFEKRSQAVEYWNRRHMFRVVA